MEIEVIIKDGKKIIEGIPGKKLICNEADAVELVGICGENDTNLLLLYAENLSENFFDLRSGEAGAILQKFRTYYIRGAAVLSPEIAKQGKFGEMVKEENRGQYFHVFDDREKAEEWLVR